MKTDFIHRHHLGIGQVSLLAAHILFTTVHHFISGRVVVQLAGVDNRTTRQRSRVAAPAPAGILYVLNSLT